MAENNVIDQVGEHNTLPLGAKNVRILLIDHDTDSLMFLASKFEQQSHTVTATESAKLALAFLRERKTSYDAVVADGRMPEMDIYKFVHEVHCEEENIPIMLIFDEKQTQESAREAMVHHGVCYVFSKPLSHGDFTTFWMHIPKVTLTLKRSNIDERNLKRTVANSDEASSSKPKKPRISWNLELNNKFLNAIHVLGENARPGMILSHMNVPNLNNRHVASHLQKHRNETRKNVSSSSIMPSVLPVAPPIVQRQISGMQADRAPQILRSPSWPETLGATSEVVIPSSHQISNGLQTPNQESASNVDVGTDREGSANGIHGEDDVDFWDDFWKGLNEN
ncbi:hypothetical protein POM88_027219 [Heracleum sosnowskyi]|uniref:Response regulatory domain-containing protein n=1 Tax=Heracleum sosnowskyi TaxID=360622 RepID=A0AAD8MLA3_9APIA|nr:hypothetical protein POM88_027219 [Heracleum sosnowskyi]